MGFLGGVFVYVVLWWIIFLMVLPCVVQKASSIEIGHDPGAPDNTFLSWKVLATTLITALIMAVSYPFYPLMEKALQDFVGHYEVLHLPSNSPI